MSVRVVVDTDIGTDVDDCLALGLILRSPELRIEGVTTVYGDVGLRARMVLKLLRLAGQAETPVMAGAKQTLLGKRPIFWLGHEGEGLLQPEDDALAPSAEHAVDYLVRTVMASPGQIHLLAIGPLTNVAMAFRREPRLPKKLAHLTIMGGVLRGRGCLNLPYAEHNIRCDPEAAHVVLSADARTTLVPLDVTTRVRIDRAGLARIRAADDPLAAAVADQLERYLAAVKRDYTHLHDPLAAALLIRPELVETTELHVDVELGGEHAVGATLMRAPRDEAPANAAVALEVDVPAAEELIVSRLSEPPSSV